MKRLIWLLLISSCFAQTWATWNGTTVGSSAGNVSGWNGTTIGTTATNIGAWNGLTSPGGGGGASWTRIAHGVNNASATSLTVTLNATATANSFLYCMLGTQGATITSVKDGNNNSLTLANTLTTVGGSTAVYWELVPTNTTTIVFTPSAFDALSMACAAYTGNVTTSPLDAANNKKDNGFNSGNSWDSGATATLAQSSGELVVGGGISVRSSNSITWSAGAGYQIVDSVTTANIVQLALMDNLSGTTGSGTSSNAAVTVSGTATGWTNLQVAGYVNAVKHP